MIKKQGPYPEEAYKFDEISKIAKNTY